MMRRGVSIVLVIAGLALVAGVTGAQDRPTLTGHVVDVEGKPLTGARVSIATAAVKKGISPL